MTSTPQSLKQALPGLRRIMQRFGRYIRAERRLIIGSLLAVAYVYEDLFGVPK